MFVHFLPETNNHSKENLHCRGVRSSLRNMRYTSEAVAVKMGLCKIQVWETTQHSLTVSFNSKVEKT